MDDALVQYENINQSEKLLGILILVVMDDALVLGI